MQFSATLFPAFLLLLMASNPIHANPDGAPACVINEQRIRGMGGSNQDLGYRVKAPASYTPGKPIDISITGNSDYKGLLLYVESSSNDKVRVGNFNIPAGFKSSKDKCDQQGFTAGPRSVLTHANSNPKRAGTRFQWTPDHGKCEDVTFRAVVAKEKTEWQILPPVTLSCKGDSRPDNRGDYNNRGPIMDYGNNKEYPEYDNDKGSAYPQQKYDDDFDQQRHPRFPDYNDVSPSRYGRPDEDCDDKDTSSNHDEWRPHWGPRRPMWNGPSEFPWDYSPPRYIERTREYEPAHFSIRHTRHRRQCRRHRRPRKCHRGQRVVYVKKVHSPRPTGIEKSKEEKPVTDYLQVKPSAYPQTPTQPQSTAYPQKTAYPSNDASNQSQTQPTAYPQVKPSAYPDTSNQTSAYPPTQPSTAYPSTAVKDESASAYPPTQTISGVQSATQTAYDSKPAFNMASPNGDSAYFQKEHDSY